MSSPIASSLNINSQLLTVLGPIMSMLNHRLSTFASTSPKHRKGVSKRKLNKLDKDLQDSLDIARKSLQDMINSGTLPTDLIKCVKAYDPLLGQVRNMAYIICRPSSENGHRSFFTSSFLKPPSPFLMTARGFRTRGSPSIGLGSEPSRDYDLFKDFEESSEDKKTNLQKFEKDISIKLTEEQKQSLKALLSEDSSLSLKEKQRLRIAFAEGFMAASKDPKEKSSRYKVFGIIRDVLLFVIIVVLLVSILGESSSFRRVLIGRTHEVHPEEIDVTFNDVKGAQEAKKELQEVVEFLRNPDKFSHVGGKLPKGVLLVGPPGTGKTLLARAVAGEAGVPFFHASGPEFDEVFVGQGARRVRDLFAQAKTRAPCVIFIDEIDSVGQKRTNSSLHPYANQTINQLLTELDGFKQNEGVIVIGATNRQQDLDKALLRPGRFDVTVTVPPPDMRGREELFDYYISKVKAGTDVLSEVLARRTLGFTGADIENMVNQAALRAAIDGSPVVHMYHLEYSRDKIIMGPERRSRIPDGEELQCTAYHEAGHTLVNIYSKEAAKKLHKVTIIERGPSLGHTAFVPDKERFNETKAQMLAELDALMGGRVAEELIFGNDKVTAGASSDFLQATNLATSMVKHYGMSEKVGIRTYNDSDERLSPATQEIIDAEIKRFLQDSYDRAKNIIKTHIHELKLLAEALLKYETLDADDVRRILDGKEPLLNGMTQNLIHSTDPQPPSSGGQDNKTPRVDPRPTPHPFKI